MPSIGLLFPGQGSQSVGMGRELLTHFSEAREVYDQADAVLGFSLSRIIMEGPEEELKRTDIAQPAILTATVAAWRVLEQRWSPAPSQVVAAGHSLGEYSALVAAGVMEFSTALTVVRHRGQWMQEASVQTPGSMAAVIGKSPEEVAELCRQADENQGIQVANLNCPGQVVVSGSLDALARLTDLAKTQKIRMIPLSVSGPFHSRFMAPAGEQLDRLLSGVTLQPATFPIVANISAEPLTDPFAIREALVAQVSGSVQWERSMARMKDLGVRQVVEIGPGKVLQGLMKKIDAQMNVSGVFSPESILALAAELSGGVTAR